MVDQLIMDTYFNFNISRYEGGLNCNVLRRMNGTNGTDSEDDLKDWYAMFSFWLEGFMVPIISIPGIVGEQRLGHQRGKFRD